jgi:hypothetical protein
MVSEPEVRTLYRTHLAKSLAGRDEGFGRRYADRNPDEIAQLANSILDLNQVLYCKTFVARGRTLCAGVKQQRGLCRFF